MTREQRERIRQAVAEREARREARRIASLDWREHKDMVGKKLYVVCGWTRCKFVDGYRVSTRERGWDNPAFVGKTMEEARKWCGAHPLKPNKEQRHQEYLDKLIAILEAEGYKVTK